MGSYRTVKLSSDPLLLPSDCRCSVASGWFRVLLLVVERDTAGGLPPSRDCNRKYGGFYVTMNLFLWWYKYQYMSAYIVVSIARIRLAVDKFCLYRTKKEVRQHLSNVVSHYTLPYIPRIAGCFLSWSSSSRMRPSFCSSLTVSNSKVLLSRSSSNSATHHLS